ncbi:hypothetical protein ANANG_G00185540 [Anguilla anguilla]|uniref:Phostensin/Taperin N-terminal domain-containing protein n=1 Tax=Anguilla anguilla TaxID=7936 RepID=A0A9D3RVF7_ANGAN|nr:hypothetical protein ANANG_G00185540 [Anguilla anguilla]
MSVSSLPEWKQLLLERKRKEEEEKERREREEEARLASMPAWKRGIIQRRRAKQEGGERERERGREEGTVEGELLPQRVATTMESRVSVETIRPVRQNPFIRSQSGWRRGGQEVGGATGEEAGPEQAKEGGAWPGGGGVEGAEGKAVACRGVPKRSFSFSDRAICARENGGQGEWAGPKQQGRRGDGPGTSRGGDCPNDEREGAEHHEGEGPEGAAGAEPKKEREQRSRAKQQQQQQREREAPHHRRLRESRDRQENRYRGQRLTGAPRTLRKKRRKKVRATEERGPPAALPASLSLPLPRALSLSALARPHEPHLQLRRGRLPGARFLRWPEGGACGTGGGARRGRGGARSCRAGAVQAGSGGVAAVQKQVELLHLREQEGESATPSRPKRQRRGAARTPRAQDVPEPPQTQLHSRGRSPGSPPHPASLNPRSFTVTPGPSPLHPKTPRPPPPAPRPLFSLRTSGGTQGKRGNTITITPRKTPAGRGQPGRPAPAPAPPRPTPNGTAAAPGDGGRKRYPTAEEIQVIGGYERLDRSCLVKQSRRHKGVPRHSWSEPGERACFPCPAQPNPDRENRAREGEDDEEDEEEEGGVFTSGSVRITGPEASRMLRVDESCRR